MRKERDGFPPRLLLAVAALAALSAPPAPARSQSQAGADIERRLAAPGLLALSQGDDQRALTAFEAALQQEPSSANLHFLSGVAYHQLALRQASSYRPMAETALRVALRLDADHGPAARELGRVLLEEDRSPEALSAFSDAWSDGVRDQTTAAGLTLAAYRSADYPIAAWASRQLDDSAPSTWRMRALVDAEGGEADRAAGDLTRYHVAGATTADLDAAKAEVAGWTDLRSSDPADAAKPASPMRLAQNGSTYIYSPPGYSPGGGPPPAPASNPPDGGPYARDWSDCAQRTMLNPQSGASAIGGSGNVGSAFADETLSLQALPSPCRGRDLPRMALIDAVIIRTIINGSSAHGLNLLDQLSVVLGGDLVTSHVFTGGTAAATVLRSRAQNFKIGLPTDGVAYSLNIANSTGVRSEVISRPSLLALDRQPSVFFSGSTLTVGLPGQLSGGRLGQRPVGTSLSATPTFIDDETLLLSVKAARSFFEGLSGGNFGQAVQSSRNSVTANVILHMGQTVVLSGLSERETQVDSSAVPFLGQIPGVQYLTKRATDTDFRTALIILLTPRAVQASGADEGRTSDLSEEDRRRLDNFRAHVASEFQPIPNIEAVKYHLRTNKLYAIIKRGDLSADMWEGSSERFKFMNELRGLLHF